MGEDTIDTFSPRVAAGIPDAASAFIRTLEELDPEADTSVVVIVVSNGYITLSENLPEDGSVIRLLQEICARRTADFVPMQPSDESSTD